MLDCQPPVPGEVILPSVACVVFRSLTAQPLWPLLAVPSPVLSIPAIRYLVGG